MNKILFFSVYFFTNHFSSDDDVSRKTDDAFLSGALTSATNKQLEGRWAIFQIEFESKIDVPESFPECGRDFSTSKQEAHTENILSMIILSVRHK
jgi:hypothetical protein